MSDPMTAVTVLPLAGAHAGGIATIRETGPHGMITLRVKPGTVGLAAAVKAAVGTKLPEPRRILRAAGGACAWMSPDEYLLILSHDRLAEALGALEAGLAGRHHLAVDVSDARAVFRIEGPEADQVLRKLTPADLDAMAVDEVRRSRLAQVAAAFWHEEGGYTLIAFRSVAGYVFDLLANAAKPGGQL